MLDPTVLGQRAVARPARLRAPPVPCPSTAVIAGGGVIPAPLLAELRAMGATIQPVLNPIDLTAVPGYRPSTAQQRFVRTRDTTCCFPGCNRPAEYCDLDHTIPYGAKGLTHPGNLKCLCRKHHLLKTFWVGRGGWSDEQLPDGTIVWTTPAGLTKTRAAGQSRAVPRLGHHHPDTHHPSTCRPAHPRPRTHHAATRPHPHPTTPPKHHKPNAHATTNTTSPTPHRSENGARAPNPTYGPIRVGIHTRECERHGDEWSGLAVHTGACIGAMAGVGDVYTSRRGLSRDGDLDERPSLPDPPVEVLKQHVERELADEPRHHLLTVRRTASAGRTVAASPHPRATASPRGTVVAESLR